MVIGNGKKPIETYSWMCADQQCDTIDCYKSPLDHQTVCQLWDAAELSSFHDAELAHATKKVDAIVRRIEKGNKDKKRKLSFIKFQNRLFLVWAGYGVVNAASSSRSSAAWRWHGRSRRARSSQASSPQSDFLVPAHQRPGVVGLQLLNGGCASSAGSRGAPSPSSTAGRRDVASATRQTGALMSYGPYYPDLFRRAACECPQLGGPDSMRAVCLGVRDHKCQPA